MLSLHRHLHLGEVVGGILAVPRSVDVAESRVADDLQPLLLNVFHNASHCLCKQRVVATMAVAQRFRYGRCLVEMQDVGVGVHLAHRFAVFHVDIGIFVFGVVFNGVAVLRLGDTCSPRAAFQDQSQCSKSCQAGRRKE